MQRATWETFWRLRSFWKAIEKVFPGTKHQWCWVHKIANVLNKVAFSVQVNMKADLREIYGA
jgi:putative transposase